MQHTLLTTATAPPPPPLPLQTATTDLRPYEFWDITDTMIDSMGETLTTVGPWLGLHLTTSLSLSELRWVVGRRYSDRWQYLPDVLDGLVSNGVYIWLLTLPSAAVANVDTTDSRPVICVPRWTSGAQVDMMDTHVVVHILFDACESQLNPISLHVSRHLETLHRAACSLDPLTSDPSLQVDTENYQYAGVLVLLRLINVNNSARVRYATRNTTKGSILDDTAMDKNCYLPILPPLWLHAWVKVIQSTAESKAEFLSAMTYSHHRRCGMNPARKELALRVMHPSFIEIHRAASYLEDCHSEDVSVIENESVLHLLGM